MTRNEEMQTLRAEIKAAEAELEPKKKRLMDLYYEQQDEVEARLKSGDKFTADELVYASDARCSVCSAGLAYPDKVGPRGSWYCSTELLAGGVANHVCLPFMAYEIKSELQASACGRTTRPKPESKPDEQASDGSKPLQP